MLRSVARFYRQILPPDPSADTFASLIESLSQEEFERLLQRIPSEIADRDPTNYDEFAGITAAELARLAGL
jgi:hypothetical protein